MSTAAAPEPTPAVSGPERGALAALTVAFLAIVTMWMFLTPVFGAPDEHAHVNSAVRLTQELSWPAPGDARLYGMVAGARDQAEALPADDRSTFAELAAAVPGPGGVDQMSQHPPLYYAYGALVLKAIGFMDMRADVAVLGLRMAGLVFAVPLPFLVWASVRRVTGSPKAGLVAASALIGIPQLAQIYAGVSNDGAAILAGALVAWLATRAMTGRGGWGNTVAIGVALAVALLVKGTLLPFVPWVAVVLLVWPRDLPLSRRLLRTASALAIAFVGGWWWLRNLIRFGDIQPSGLAGVRPEAPWAPGTGPDVVAYLERLWTRMAGSFWGNFGALEYPLPQFLTDVLTVVSLGVIVVYAFGRGATRRYAIVHATLPAVLVVMLVANTWRHYVRTQEFAGLQGRYLFVALVSLLVLSAIGWMRFVPGARRRSVGIGLIAVFPVIAAWGVLRAYVGAYEGDAYRVTLDGLRAWGRATPGGIPAIVAVGLVTLGVVAVAVALTVRAVAARHVEAIRSAA